MQFEDINDPAGFGLEEIDQNVIDEQLLEAAFGTEMEEVKKDEYKKQDVKFNIYFADRKDLDERKNLDFETVRHENGLLIKLPKINGRRVFVGDDLADKIRASDKAIRDADEAVAKSGIPEKIAELTDMKKKRIAALQKALEPEAKAAISREIEEIDGLLREQSKRILDIRGNVVDDISRPVPAAGFLTRMYVSVSQNRVKLYLPVLFMDIDTFPEFRLDERDMQNVNIIIKTTRGSLQFGFVKKNEKKFRAAWMQLGNSVTKKGLFDEWERSNRRDPDHYHDVDHFIETTIRKYTQSQTAGANDQKLEQFDEKLKININENRREKRAVQSVIDEYYRGTAPPPEGQKRQYPDEIKAAFNEKRKLENTARKLEKSRDLFLEDYTYEELPDKTTDEITQILDVSARFCVTRSEYNMDKEAYEAGKDITFEKGEEWREYRTFKKGFIVKNDDKPLPPIKVEEEDYNLIANLIKFDDRRAMVLEITTPNVERLIGVTNILKGRVKKMEILVKPFRSYEEELALAEQDNVIELEKKEEEKEEVPQVQIETPMEIDPQVGEMQENVITMDGDQPKQDVASALDDFLNF